MTAQIPEQRLVDGRPNAMCAELLNDYFRLAGKKLQVEGRRAGGLLLITRQTRHTGDSGVADAEFHTHRWLCSSFASDSSSAGTSS